MVRSLILICLSLLCAGFGPEDRPAQQALSADRAYRLRITAGRPGRTACSAVLEHRPRGARPRIVWEADLVNDVAPLQAFVHDSGAWVVTLDEFRLCGAAHALVVYGEDGTPGREWTLDEILAPHEWEHVEERGDVLDWLGTAKRIGFAADAPHFVIDFEHGGQVRVDLERLELIAARTGALVTNPDTPAEVAPPHPLGALLEMLSSGALPPALEILLADPNMQIVPDPNRAIRAIDVPVGPRDIDDVPFPQPGDPIDYVDWANSYTNAGEAAGLLKRAAELAQQAEIDYELLDAAMEGEADALNDPAVAEWLGAQEEAIDLLRQACEKEFGGYHLATDDDDARMIGILLPTLAPLRQLAKAQVIRGKQFELAGDHEAAAAEYLAVLRSGGQTGRGVTLIEGLVGIAVEALATRSLVDLCANDTEGRIDYTNLLRQIESARIPHRPMHQTMQFERAMMLDEVQRLYEYDEYEGYRLRPGGLRDYATMVSLTGPSEPPLGMFAAGMALSSRGFETIVGEANGVYDDMTAASQLPFVEAQAAFGQIEQSVEEYGMTNPIVSALVPSLRRASQMYTRNETNLRAARTITRIRAYEQQYGVLPAALEDLGDTLDIVDPFTSAPLRYVLDGDGFRLYTIGPDGIDDGGAHNNRLDEGDYQFWPPVRD